MNHLALPPPLYQCANRCGLWLLSRGLIELAKADPTRVSLVVCARCLLTLSTYKSAMRKGA